MNKEKLIEFVMKDNRYEYVEDAECIKINKKELIAEPYIEYSKLDLTIKLYYKDLYNELKWITLLPNDCEILKILLEME